MKLEDIKKLTPTQQEYLKQWINDYNRKRLTTPTDNERKQK